MSPGLARIKPGVSRRDFLVAGLGALATPLLPGCRLLPSETQQPPVTSARLTARPGTPTATPTLGLSQLGLALHRDGALYVPTGYTPENSAPLFVALLGAGGSSTDWQNFVTRAEARGMVLLMPESRASTWDLLGPGFEADRAFVDLALAYTFERCRIDPSRIALGGFSDGASCALSLGLTNGDLFTNLVAYSPGMIVLNSQRIEMPNVFISHGTLDSVIPESISKDGLVPYLQTLGYEVLFQEFEGGHEVPAAVAEASLDWFLGTTPPIPPQTGRRLS